MKSVYQNIADWAIARNFHEGSTVQAQMVKLMEEQGELTEEIVSRDLPCAMKELGDNVVVLVVICNQSGIQFPEHAEHGWVDTPQAAMLNVGAAYGGLANAVCKGHPLVFPMQRCARALQGVARALGVGYEACVRQAYEKIKDRKGRMVDGVFVKGEDLK